MYIEGRKERRQIHRTNSWWRGAEPWSWDHVALRLICGVDARNPIPVCRNDTDKPRKWSTRVMIGCLEKRAEKLVLISSIPSATTAAAAAKQQEETHGKELRDENVLEHITHQTLYTFSVHSAPSKSSMNGDHCCGCCSWEGKKNIIQNPRVSRRLKWKEFQSNSTVIQVREVRERKTFWY